MDTRELTTSRRKLLKTGVATSGLVGLGVSTFSSAAAAQSCTHVVDAAGKGDFSTIQAAVNNATSGDTICVKPTGPYNESVNFGVDGLTLKGDSGQRGQPGAGNNAPVLDGIAGDDLTSRRAFALFDWEKGGAAKDIEINGFEIRNYNIGIGPTLQNRNIRTRNNYIHHVRSAIDVDGQDCDIAFNRIEDAAMWGINLPTGPNQTRHTVRHNEILSPQSNPDTYQQAIRITCHANPNDDTIPPDVKTSDITVTDNVVNGWTKGAAIDISAFVRGEEGSAEIRDVIIDSNRFVDCDRGVRVLTSLQDGVQGVEFSENQIRSMNIGMLLGGAAPNGVEVHKNNIAGNTKYGVLNEGTGTVSATCNWWGAANGPEHDDNKGGRGDTVSNGVNFDPWLPQQFEKVPDESCSGQRGT